MLVQEATTGVISLEEDDPNAVNIMLKFLYTGDCPYFRGGLDTAIETYVLADKYDLPTLAAFVVGCFKGLRVVEEKLTDLVEAVRTIYLKTSNGSALRKAASKIIHDNAKKVFKTEKPRHWISEVDGLCLDLYFLSMGWEGPRECLNRSIETYEVVCEHCAFMSKVRADMGLWKVHGCQHTTLNST